MNIKRVQTELNQEGFGPLLVDGIAGAKTYDAIKHFQLTRGLNVDGRVGPETLAALFPVQEQRLSNNLAQRATQIAMNKEGVRELTGNNDGPEVEAYLKSVGLGKGYSWCMAFVVSCFDDAAKQLGVNMPLVRTGGCMDQWNRTTCQKVTKPQTGDIFIIDLGNGAGHTGIVVAVNGDEVETIEGNTNDNGSANGDGVYRRTRKIARMKGFIRC